MVRRFSLLAVASFLFLALATAQDVDRLYQQEKAQATTGPAGKLYPPALFKQLETLEGQIKDAKQPELAELLQQQARWLTPETPQVPDHVSRVMGTLKFKHEQYPVSVVYAPSGDSIYTSSRDGTVKQWNLQNGRVMKTWQLQKPLAAMALSPDSTLLAVAEGYRMSPNIDPSSLPAQDEYTIHLIDLSTGAIKTRLSGTKGVIYSIAFSRDGKLLACGSQTGKSDPLRVWNVETGQLERSFKVIHALLAVAWSADGSKLFAATTDRTLAVFDSKTGLQVLALPRERGPIFAMTLSPDSRQLAMGGELLDEANTPVIKIFDAQSGKLQHTLAGHTSPVTSLCFTHEGKLISGSAKPEASIKVWDIPLKTALTQYQGHCNDVIGLTSIRTKSSIISTSLDGSTRLWQTSQVKPARTLFQGKQPVWALASQGKKLLAVGADQTATIWNMDTSKELHRFTEHQSPVTAGCFRPDGGEVATGGGDFIIRLWDPATGKAGTTLTGHTGVITALVYSTDGKRLYSASADKTIRFWDIAEKKTLHTLSQHRSVVTTLALNDTGSLLASGGADNLIRIWRTHDASELRSLIGHTGAVTGLSFSPGGTMLASVGADGLTKIWDPVNQGKAMKTMAGHSGQLMAIAFSPNNKYLATAGADETIRVWNLLSGGDNRPLTEARALQGHSDWVTSLTFLNEGEALVSASVDGSIKVWQESKAFEQPVFGHEHPVKYLTISADGTRLASGSEEGKIILWDTTTGNPQATLASHVFSIKGLTFSQNGKLLASVDTNQTVKLWEVAGAKELQSFPSVTDTVNKISFLPGDRGVIASIGSSNILAWALEDNQLKPEARLSFLGYERHCNAVSFGQDRVALGATDGMVKFWKLNDFKYESDSNIRAYPVAVLELTVSRDGKRMLTTNQENEFALWNLEDKTKLTSWNARPARLLALALHPSNGRVLAAFDTSEVVLWDHTGKELRNWKFSMPMNDVIFSPTKPEGYVGSTHGVVYQLVLP
jgi:WD40 repeat protein